MITESLFSSSEAIVATTWLPSAPSPAARSRAAVHHSTVQVNTQDYGVSNDGLAAAQGGWPIIVVKVFEFIPGSMPWVRQKTSVQLLASGILAALECWGTPVPLDQDARDALQTKPRPHLDNLGARASR